ncbi:MAG TPA: hypothetical protein VK590_00550 [Saprospiraceae bacterium]|nr:hypothetical protein [Saprospiraceae bacterium]
MNINQIRKFSFENFNKISNLIFFSDDDDKILELVSLIEVERELIDNIKPEIDFLTFFALNNLDDIDLILLGYFGNKVDSGFLCFYLPNIVFNQSNIFPILVALHNKQTQFDINAIREEMIKDINGKLSLIDNIQFKSIKQSQIFYFKYLNK